MKRVPWLAISIIISTAIVLTCFAARPVQASPILDQAYIPGAFPTVGSGIGYTDKAQTFTVGMEGILTRVDTYIERYRTTHPLIFDIRATSGGVPIESDANVLASIVLDAADVPNTIGFFSFDIRSFGMHVVPGEVYAIVLRAGYTDTVYGWQGDQMGSFGITQDPYSLGSSYFRNPAYGITSWTLMAGIDHGFRTFVDPAPVPEPGTLILLGSGLAGLRIIRKRIKS